MSGLPSFTLVSAVDSGADGILSMLYLNDFINLRDSSSVKFPFCSAVSISFATFSKSCFDSAE